MVIGVAGAIGSGKDTVAAYLVREHGFTRIGWADALKAEVRRYYRRTMLRIAAYVMPLDLAFVDEDVRVLAGADDEATLDWLERTKPPMIRELYQDHGAARRAENPRYWIDRLEEKAGGIQRLVIPDTRHVNEASWVTGGPRFGRLLKVERPGHVGAGHESETSLAKWTRWDAVLPNVGTVADLEAAVAWWLEHP